MNITWLFLLIPVLCLMVIIYYAYHYKTTNIIHEYNTDIDISGIAIDDHNLYIIGSNDIHKYSRKSGKKLAHKKLPFHHLGDAKIVNGDLIVINNAPHHPAVIWVDPNDLSIIDLITPDYVTGDLIWIDWALNKWWLYDEHHHKAASRILCYDNDWNLLGLWTLPKEISDGVIGGAWLGNHLVIHQNGKLALLKLPPTKVPVDLAKTQSVSSSDAGFAVEQKHNHNYVWSTKGGRVLCHKCKNF